ncbi:MAG: hypothetical protein L0387_30330 [Acidobacteria bacterium]|nr:hypothetical protein [Acidobacteriota bacterium]
MLPRLLTLVACGRYGLKKIDDQVYERPDGSRVVLLLMMTTSHLNFCVRSMKINRHFSPERFVEFYRDRVIEAIVATVEKFWFVPSEDILSWHRVGILRKGKLKSDLAWHPFDFPDRSPNPSVGANVQ